MTILARFQNQDVEILDVYEANGVKMCSLRAVYGTPFVGGDRWPVWTAYTIAPAGELSEVHQERHPGEAGAQAKPARPNLLDLALAQAKPQWYTGETVWIWRNNGKGGAYLKNNGGFVSLCLTGHQPSCVIFYLLPIGWQTSKVVKADYRKWVEKLQEAK